MTKRILFKIDDQELPECKILQKLAGLNRKIFRLRLLFPLVLGKKRSKAKASGKFLEIYRPSFVAREGRVVTPKCAYRFSDYHALRTQKPVLDFQRPFPKARPPLPALR